MKRRGGSRPPTPAAVILEPLSDHVLDVLFRQSIIGMQRGDPYLDGVRRLARLIEAELQGQVYEDAGERFAEWKRRHPLKSQKQIDHHLAASAKGGRVSSMRRNAKMTPEERSELGRKLARARWAKA